MRLKSMKIAIVEDDINMRKSLEIALGDYDDFEVQTFRNAKEALKKLDDSFNLVISDITMPGMDGITFLEKLRCLEFWIASKLYFAAFVFLGTKSKHLSGI